MRIFFKLAGGVLLLVLVVAGLVVADMLPGRLRRQFPDVRVIEQGVTTAEYYVYRGSETYQTEGADIFVQHCALCHGKEGRRGRAADLSRLRRAKGGLDLFRLIRRGITDTEMPAYQGILTHADTFRLVAYIEGLQDQTGPEQVAGDAQLGAEAFAQQGCMQCHTVGGAGGVAGPDLTVVGLRRSAAFLKRKILDPAAEIHPDHQIFEAVPHDGTPVRGLVKNEDTFSVQLQEPGGKIHSFWKRDLQSLREIEGESLMPSYEGRVSEDDLLHLVTYLSTLQRRDN